MWLVVKAERRRQPRAGAAVRCRNTSHRRKSRVNYEKISLLIVCPFAKFPRQHRVNYTSCMSFCKDSTPSTYQWLCYRASRSSITINVLVVLRQVVGLTQFIVFRQIFVWKGFLLLMSWKPSASLDFPVETSTASFSRCSEMLLAGSEIGKSEGIEHLEWPPAIAWYNRWKKINNNNKDDNIVVEKLLACILFSHGLYINWKLYSVRMAQGKSRMGKFISFNLAISSLYFNFRKISPA